MSSREKFEAWVMTEVCISKSTLEGLRIDNGYRNSTLSGTDYNRMWSCWQAVESASEQKLTDMAVQLANAESKCREMAAELSAVDKIHNEAVFITDDHYEQCPPGVQKMIRSLAVLQIPAYDAFLAEVRSSAKADGVQEYADSFRHAASKHRELHGETIRVKALLHEAENADKFAAQLRKGAAL